MADNLTELDAENGRLTGTVIDLQRAMRHALAHLDQILGSRPAEDARAVLKQALENTGGLPTPTP